MWYFIRLKTGRYPRKYGIRLAHYKRYDRKNGGVEYSFKSTMKAIQKRLKEPMLLRVSSLGGSGDEAYVGWVAGHRKWIPQVREKPKVPFNDCESATD